MLCTATLDQWCYALQHWTGGVMHCNTGPVVLCTATRDQRCYALQHWTSGVMQWNTGPVSYRHKDQEELWRPTQGRRSCGGQHRAGGAMPASTRSGNTGRRSTGGRNSQQYTNVNYKNTRTTKFIPDENNIQCIKKRLSSTSIIRVKFYLQYLCVIIQWNKYIHIHTYMWNTEFKKLRTYSKSFRTYLRTYS